MPQQVKVQCHAFKKNPDGTWVSTDNSDIQTPEKTVRINPGIVFKPGIVLWGIDVVGALEENCPQG